MSKYQQFPGPLRLEQDRTNRLFALAGCGVGILFAIWCMMADGTAEGVVVLLLVLVPVPILVGRLRHGC